MHMPQSAPRVICAVKPHLELIRNDDTDYTDRRYSPRADRRPSEGAAPALRAALPTAEHPAGPASACGAPLRMLMITRIWETSSPGEMGILVTSSTVACAHRRFRDRLPAPISMSFAHRYVLVRDSSVTRRVCRAWCGRLPPRGRGWARYPRRVAHFCAPPRSRARFECGSGAEHVTYAPGSGSGPHVGISTRYNAGVS